MPDIERLVAESDTMYPALFQLCGGYFHQDWRSEHADSAAAIAAFKVEVPSDAVRDAVSEIDRILSAGFDEDDLAALINDGFDCSYVPPREGVTYAAWLASIRDALLRESA